MNKVIELLNSNSRITHILILSGNCSEKEEKIISEEEEFDYLGNTIKIRWVRIEDTNIFSTRSVYNDKITLIHGRRAANKANKISTVLKRIEIYNTFN